MKRFFTLILVLVSVTLCAWPRQGEITVPMGGQMGYDGTNWVPIAVDSTGATSGTGGGTSATVDSSGAGHVAPKGATSAASTRWLITSAGQSWTLTASATDFTLFNLGSNTVDFDINMGGATVGASIPLTATGTGQCQQGRDAALGMVVNMVAATPTYVLGVEGRR